MWTGEIRLLDRLILWMGEVRLPDGLIMWTGEVRVGSHCDDNDIVFSILMSSNIDVTNGHCGTIWRCSHGSGIFKTQNCCCCDIVNKA